MTSFRHILTWLPAIVLLAALPVLRTVAPLSVAPPDPSDPALAAVRAAADAMPHFIAPRLVGEDRPLPPAAVEMLRPNATVSRDFTDLATRRVYSFLMVHAHDLNDMVGHYPPACYPAHGWTTAAEVSSDHTVRAMGHDLPVRVYRFERSDDLGRRTGIYVANLFLLPDGGATVDMASLRRRGGRRALAQQGVAQVQILTDDAVEIDTLLDTMESVLAASGDLLPALGVDAASAAATRLAASDTGPPS